MNKQGNLIRKHRTTLRLWTRLLLANLMAFVFCGVSVLWAQGNAQSSVNQAAHAHGDGWQNGAVKSWAATGQVTVYRYDRDGRQSQETFPTILLHQADPLGGGSQGDKLQRLIFKAPEASAGAGPSQPVSVNAFSFDRLLTREGSDGVDQWHSAGPFSTAAAGRTQRFIESQTERSFEALFNFQKQGKNVDDVTARVVGLAPNGLAAPNDPHRGRAHAIPSFEAAKNHHVMELSDPPGSGHPHPHDQKSTRYFIDDATALITRLEFEYDTATDAISNQAVALTEVYEFSDYRDVLLISPNPLTPSRLSTSNATVKFPFRIDRYVTGQLVESLIFTQVALNRGLRSENFRR